MPIIYHINLYINNNSSIKWIFDYMKNKAIVQLSTIALYFIKCYLDFESA
jgi:hypothetical protein